MQLIDIPNDDLQHIVRRLPKDVRQMMLDKQVFLGGGFIRDTIMGEKPSDIDLFCPTATEADVLAKTLTLERKGELHETKNAITVFARPRIPVQFITRWLYDSPVTLLEEFDFTISQAVVWVSTEEQKVSLTETKKVKVWRGMCNARFYQDLAAKRLVYTAPNRKEDAGGSLLRVMKFLKRGYNIQAPSLGGVIARLVENVEYGAIESKSVTWQQVITGLLREVDPLLAVDGEFVPDHVDLSTTTE